MNNFKNKYIKYKNKYINLKGGYPTELDIHFYAHVLLEEESSPFIGNSIQNVIDHFNAIVKNTHWALSLQKVFLHVILHTM